MLPGPFRTIRRTQSTAHILDEEASIGLEPVTQRPGDRSTASGMDSTWSAPDGLRARSSRAPESPPTRARATLPTSTFKTALSYVGLNAKGEDFKEGSFSLKRIAQHSAFANYQMLTGIGVIFLAVGMVSRFIKSPPPAGPFGFTEKDIDLMLAVNPTLTLSELRSMKAANLTDARFNVTMSAVRSLAGTSSNSVLNEDFFIWFGAMMGLVGVLLEWRTAQGESIYKKGRRDDLATAADNSEKKLNEVRPHLDEMEGYVKQSILNAAERIEDIRQSGKAEEAATGKVDAQMVRRAKDNYDWTVELNFNRPYLKFQVEDWLNRETRRSVVYPVINDHIKLYPPSIKAECKLAYLSAISRSAELKVTMDHFAVQEAADVRFPRKRVGAVASKLCIGLIGSHGGTGKDHWLTGLKKFNMPVASVRVPIKSRGGANELLPKEWNAFNQTSFPTTERDLKGLFIQAIFDALDKHQPEVGVNPVIYLPEVDIHDPVTVEVLKILMDPDQALIDWLTIHSKFDINNCIIVFSANVDDIDSALKTRLQHCINFTHSTLEAQARVAENRYKEMSRQFVEPLSNGKSILSGEESKAFVDYMESLALPELLKLMGRKVPGARGLMSQVLTTYVATHCDEHGVLPTEAELMAYLATRFEAMEECFRIEQTPAEEVAAGEPATRRVPVKPVQPVSEQPPRVSLYGLQKWGVETRKELHATTDGVRRANDSDDDI